MTEIQHLLERAFEFENNFYLTAPVSRISKFVTHLDLYRRISTLRGEIVECGVFKGNSFSRWVKFRSLLENDSSRKVIGFDSFGAFPETEIESDQASRAAFIKETGGGNSIDREEYLAVLKALKLDKGVELIAGDICETVPQYIREHPQLKIALLNIDVDLFEPTKVILEALYPYVVRGGIVLLDDYGAMPGANRAIDRYFAGVEGFRVQQLPYSSGLAFIEKP